MAKAKKKAIQAFIQSYGSQFSGLTPSQIDEITAILQSGDIDAARRQMDYMTAASRGGDNIPRGEKRFTPAADPQPSGLAVREARPSREYPITTYSPPPETPRPIPTIKIPPRDTSGDNIRNLLKYGAEAAAIGAGGYLAANYPWGDAGQEARQPTEDERRSALDAMLRAQEEQALQKVLAERFRMDQSMASPRN